MKKSMKISLVASILFVGISILLMALIKPTLGWTSEGGMPVMAYIVAVCSFLAPLIAIPIINAVEKHEAKGE